MDGEETQQLQGQVAGDRVPASVDALVDSWQMLPAAPNKCHDTTGCPKPLKLWRAEVTHFPCGHQVQERCVCVCVCVCVGATPVPKGFYHMSNFLLRFPIYKQGHTASLTHRVQRSYGLGWDIRADHPDVPAVGHDVFSLFKLVDAFSVSLLSYA